MRRYELPVLAALFLDLIGFGMAFPDVQIRAEKLGAPGWGIGLLLASLFAVQFFASPRWGRLSDRIGRKPVVVICTLLSAASMLVYALSNSLEGIFFSRVLAGLAAANVVVAQAYMAEHTLESERGGAMGRIGAAISVGLIGGPFLGGQLAQIGGSKLLGFVAASSSALGALILVFGMKAERPTEEKEPGKAPVIDFRLLREIPQLAPLFLIAAVSWFALACLEGTFGRLLEARFHFPNSDLGIAFTLPQGASGAIFGLESLIAFAVQGITYEPLSKRFGEKRLLVIGFMLQGLGLVCTPFAPGLALVALASSVYSFGSALGGPAINSLCSTMTPEERQGELFGLLQASRSIGFLVGPLIGGILFDLWRPGPYVLAGAIALVAMGLVGRVKASQAIESIA